MHLLKKQAEERRANRANAWYQDARVYFECFLEAMATYNES